MWMFCINSTAGLQGSSATSSALTDKMFALTDTQRGSVSGAAAAQLLMQSVHLCVARGLFVHIFGIDFYFN